MCLLIESIKIQNRVPQNLEYHNARLNSSRFELFGLSDILDLHDYLRVPNDLTNDVYKCRVVYKETIQYQQYLPYTPKTVKTLKLVVDENIDYKHKYLDRSRLDKLRAGSGSDDILIVKDNCITDASSANVVFYDGTAWLTPSDPLLRGTKRQQLLDMRIIHEKKIEVQDLRRFQKCALINAMRDLDREHYISVNNIIGI